MPVLRLRSSVLTGGNEAYAWVVCISQCKNNSLLWWRSQIERAENSARRLTLRSPLTFVGRDQTVRGLAAVVCLLAPLPAHEVPVVCSHCRQRIDTE